ncbi:unnamed protein product [Arabidopsis thaliana]|nr:unnamed protein product [Arabidopsis thaliana]
MLRLKKAEMAALMNSTIHLELSSDEQPLSDGEEALENSHIGSLALKLPLEIRVTQSSQRDYKKKLKRRLVLIPVWGYSFTVMITYLLSKTKSAKNMNCVSQVSDRMILKTALQGLSNKDCFVSPSMASMASGKVERGHQLYRDGKYKEALLFYTEALTAAKAKPQKIALHSNRAACYLKFFLRESISHVLFHCWPAREVWERVNIPLPTHGFTPSITDNLDFVFNLMSNDGLSLSLRMANPWLLWGIWKHRNTTVLAGTQGDLNALIAHAFEESKVWNKLRTMPTQSVTRLSLNPRCAVRWTKPPLDTLKCNIHVSWLNDVHICGGAWIVRNHHGDAAFHAREMFLPASNRIAAELRGVLWVLHSLRDLHLDNIEI